MKVRALALAAVVAVALVAVTRPARADLPSDANIVALDTASCEAHWARFDELALALRVEFHASGLDLAVVRGKGREPRMLRIYDCAPHASLLKLDAYAENHGLRSRAMSLSDVAETNWTRTLAIAMVDLWREVLALPGPLPVPTVVTADVTPDVAPPRLQVAPPSHPVTREDRRALTASLETATTLRDPQLFAGGAIELTLPITRSGAEGPLIRAALGLSLLYAEREVAIGTAALVVPAALGGVTVMFPIGRAELGVGFALRPGAGISYGNTSRADVLTSRAVDPVLDVRVVAEARVPLMGPWFVQGKAGVGYVVKGVELEVEGARSFAFSDWAFPVQLGLGASL